MSEGQTAEVAGGTEGGASGAGAAAVLTGSDGGGQPNVAVDSGSEGGSGSAEAGVGVTGAAGESSVDASSGSEAAWSANLPDDFRGYAEKKGWSGPEAVVESYRNLEKLIGVKDRLVTLPESVEDADGWNDVYKKLGRPDSPEDYQVNWGDKSDDNFVGWARKNFHEIGLSNQQAAALTDRWNEMNKNLSEEQNKAQSVQFEQEFNQLKSEWGAAYEKHLSVAKRAVAELNIDNETIGKLEQTMGFSGVMKMMQKIGDKFSEASFVAGDRPVGLDAAVTPEQAKHEIAELKKDKNWQKQYLEGDKAARRRFSQLHKWAYPGESTI
jgi:hypothetical protein